MREIRQSGSEGGGTEVNPFSLPLLKLRRHAIKVVENESTALKSEIENRKSPIENRQFVMSWGYQAGRRYCHQLQ